MATIYCPACGHENDAAAKFCEDCGRSLADVSEIRARSQATGTRPRRTTAGKPGSPPPTGMPADSDRDDRLLDDDGRAPAHA